MVVIASLIFGFLGIAAAQTIENAPGVTDPVKLKVMALYYRSSDPVNKAYTYTVDTNQDGSKSYLKKDLVLALNSSDNAQQFSYDVYSKNGTVVASHAISKNVYQRLMSILSQSKKEYSGSNTIVENNDSCFVSIAIDRTSLQLTKVTPSCDDLQ